MSSPADWPTISDEHLLDCKVIDVHRVRARAPTTDTEHTFFRLVSPDWVNIIPLTPEGEVVMVKQYRHGSRDVTLEIPGGMVDAGETPQAAAVRELREETGYTVDGAQLIGAVNPNPALFDNHLHTFLAKGAVEVGEVANEGAEETHVVRVPLDEIPRLMREGAITHALVVAAFHWLVLHDAP